MIAEEELTAVYTANRGYFLRYARRLVGENYAEDLVQDAFIKAFGALDKFNGGCALRTWVTSILIREALMYRRKKHYQGESICGAVLDQDRAVLAHQIADIAQRELTGAEYAALCKWLNNTADMENSSLRKSLKSAKLKLKEIVA